MKKNSILRFVTFSLLVVLLFSLNVYADSENIKFGGIFNLTGALAALDNPARNGAALAVKEINAKGGVLGKQIELIVEDGKTDVTSVVRATEKLISINHIDVLFGLCDTNYVLAAGVIANSNEVPFLDVGGTMPEIPDLVGEYQFLVCFGDDIQAIAMANFAYDELDARNVALFYDSGINCAVTIVRYFTKRWEELGGKVVLEDTHQSTDVDFRAQITRIKNLDPQPDLILVSPNPDVIGILIKQIREMGVDIPIITGDVGDTPLVVEVAGELADKFYYTTHIAFESDDPLTKSFFDNYRKEYNREPENSFAALGYDSVYLLADAIKRAGSTDGDAVRIALGKTKNYPAVTGNISYLEGERVPHKSVSIKKVIKGEVSFVKTVMP